MSYEDDEYIKVCAEEDADFVEFPKESDNTVLLSTLQSQFPTAIGLRYRGSSGAWRSLRVEENILSAPKDGWSDRVYCVTVSESGKRKADKDCDEVVPKRSRVNPLLQDMAVMNLPFTTDDQELRDYFEKNYGELEYCEVKKFKETGRSRGYGFIRFKVEETAKAAIEAEHHLSGRRIELKTKQTKPMKLFVGRCPDNITKEDLENYFSKFGTLTDVYIPKPFKNFAFITYASSEEGKEVIAGSHQLGGNRLNVMERKTPEEGRAEALAKDRHFSGSGRDRDSRDNYSSTPSRDSYRGMPPSRETPSFSPSSGGYYSRDYVRPSPQSSYDNYSSSQRQSSGSSGGGSGGGNMDKELKTILMKYLASQ